MLKWTSLAVIGVCLLAVGLQRMTSCQQLEPTDDQHKPEDYESWAEFKRQFNRSYERAEDEQRRMEIFLDNRRFIESQNLKAGQRSFEQALNPLSDLTAEEVVATRCGFRLETSDEADFYHKATGERLLESLLGAFNASHWDQWDRRELPDSPANSSALDQQRAWYENVLSAPELDYRARGVVSRVKDQGACGSCWAFATTGALESQLALRGRQLLLSEQNLVDCSQRYGNHGCRGGLMTQALRYVRDHGLMASKDYPYVGLDNKCQARPGQTVVRGHGPLTLPRGNEALLRVALALTGPIPVAIDAGARSFHSYKSGVYDDTVCRNSQRALNHAVLLVGYGSQLVGGDFWILKNSWGRSWGENGYIKMARNRANLCGVATFATLPLP